MIKTIKTMSMALTLLFLSSKLPAQTSALPSPEIGRDSLQEMTTDDPVLEIEENHIALNENKKAAMKTGTKGNVKHETFYSTKPKKGSKTTAGK